ncbi:hypothetical protein ACFFOS_17210 [Nocardioides kongjuensis]|uniref:ESX secretion-associated protein EspG n=1 Tax=Nocardioides kongjuensis TaxID=349522 RepID=A0A852RX82_9ACTN|nr:hypothetical protein [Nocardioides kongjuensis]NYD33796.1 hypothetical protein [Nocardioides kongjuensis]
MDLLLTDDEVVALAADRESFWPGALPTVPMVRPDDAIRAVLRGQRSLRVRDLLSEAGESTPQLVELRDSVLDAEGRIAVYLCDEAFDRVSWDISADLYWYAPGWLVETTTAAGIHAFRQSSRAEATELLVGLTSAALSGGGGERLCVALVTERESKAVVVSAGTITGYVLDPAGTVTAEKAVPPSALPQLLGMLTDHAASIATSS